MSRTPHRPGRWLLLESYFDGSHRRLVEGIRRHVAPAHRLWTLPARKWKWRMRGASLAFARRVREERPEVDAIFASSLMNAAELRALLPPRWRELPLVVYFHENQLRYPVRHFDKRDHHFGWSNLHSALAADRLLFNSAYNRDSFLEDLDAVIRKMPDQRPHWVIEDVAERGEVLPVPIDDAEIDAVLVGVGHERRGPAHVVWNHRWEFDKNPELLLQCVEALESAGVEYALSVLGQGFEECPPVFESVRRTAGARIRRWGHLEDRADYLRCLATADVALSTASHEFQGLAVLEAAACGAVPLVPDDLAYPEIWPQEWRHAHHRLPAALVGRVRDVATWREVDPRERARRWGWTRLAPAWREVFAAPPAPRDG